MKRAVKITAIVLASLIGLGIFIVAGYVIYVAAQYYRIEDSLQLDVSDRAQAAVSLNTQYSIITYNLGFGAYSPEYSFFMDTGVMNDGSEVVGKYAKGLNSADVKKNVDGQIALARDIGADFCFFQEVDEKADRSYKINMRQEMETALSNYSSAFAQNFHTANLLYPFSDPIGKSQSGILTLSRYKIESSVRRSFPITSAFPDKFFDLDRCFSLSYVSIEGSDKHLTLLNLHMSAYDEGGKIRAKQLEMLNRVLAEERASGNYVVAGGDFNHCLIADNFATDSEALNYFKSEQAVPDWVKNSVLHSDEIAEGYVICAPVNEATCRGADIPYKKGVNYSTVIDGFLVSDNIEIIQKRTVDTQYAYSDHNPVYLEFRLKV